MWNERPQLHEERLPVLLDEFQRFVGKQLGRFGAVVRLVGGALCPAPLGAANEIKAVFVWWRSSRIASQMPFADVSRRIAGPLEQRRVVGNLRIEKLTHSARLVQLG